MPDHERRDLYQIAVLWSKVRNDRHGAPVVGAPVEIPVRWNDKRRESTDKDSAVISVDATVVVERQIAVGSNMWLGELEDWLGTGSGSGDAVTDDVMQVISYNETLDIKGRCSRREVSLMRFKSREASQ